MAFELIVLSGPCRCGDSMHLALRQSYVIGRELEADFRVRNDLQMSSAHFSIEATIDACEIVDLESTNGTFLNGRRITRESVRPGDEIRAGNTTFEVQSIGPSRPAISENTDAADQRGDDFPAKLLALETSDGERRELASGQRLIIGRTESADWIFATDIRMSSQHFAIQTANERWEVVDLSSTNGTYLNGRRIEQEWLNSGDEIRAGTTAFQVTIETVSSARPSVEEPHVPTIASFKTIEPRSPEEMAHEPPVTLHDRLVVPGSYVLRCLTREEWSITIRPGESFILGRSSDVDLSMPEASQVSSRHACLSVNSDHCLLTDLNSANGTFLNGRQIREESVACGDRISLANVVFELDKVSEEQLPFLSDDASNAKNPYEQPDPWQTNWPSDHEPQTLAHEPQTLAALANMDDPSSRLAPAAHSLSGQPVSLPPLAVQVEGVLPFEEIPYESFPCGSGLVLYRGGSARFDPIDVARRLLLASPGWMVVAGANHSKASDPRSESNPASIAFEVTPLSPDDVSWMLPWNAQWGQQHSLIVYSRSDAKRIESSFEQLGRLIGVNDWQADFASDSFNDFLANRLQDTVHRFFSPFDAILVEISGGKRWAYFAPKELETVMSHLRFRRRRSW